MLCRNGVRFEINQLLFANVTSLVAVSEGKYCRLVSEFDKSIQKKKLRLNAGMSKGTIYVRLNGELLEEVDCFK